MNSTSRYGLFFRLFVMWVVVVSGGCAELSLSRSDSDPSPSREQTIRSGENLGSRLVSFYGKYISSVDGDRCPSIPSCSSYSRGAFKKHGFFMGWMMTVDRLVHEADERSVSPVAYQEGRLKVLDPVENNDFWWYRQ